ncbi:phage baseplate protein, partial [Azospirillum brasilense]|nr:phage baseplate protein [Azospirillum brasilense]
MPFSRPTLSDLRAQVAQDLPSAVGAGTDLLRRAVLRVLGEARAAVPRLHHGYWDGMPRQHAPLPGGDERLEGGPARTRVTRKPASAATGTVTFAGSPGAILQAGTSVTRYDGAAYTTDDAVAVGGGGAAARARTGGGGVGAGDGRAGGAGER